MRCRPTAKFSAGIRWYNQTGTWSEPRGRQTPYPPPPPLCVSTILCQSRFGIIDVLQCPRSGTALFCSNTDMLCALFRRSSSARYVASAMYSAGSLEIHTVVCMHPYSVHMLRCSDSFRQTRSLKRNNLRNMQQTKQYFV